MSAAVRATGLLLILKRVLLYDMPYLEKKVKKPEDRQRIDKATKSYWRRVDRLRTRHNNQQGGEVAQ